MPNSLFSRQWHSAPGVPQTSGPSTLLSWEVQRLQAVCQRAGLTLASFFRNDTIFWSVRIWLESNFQKVFIRNLFFSQKSSQERASSPLSSKRKAPPPHDPHTCPAVPRKWSCKRKKPETHRDRHGSLLGRWQGDVYPQHSFTEMGLLSSVKLKIRMITRKIYRGLKGSSDITVMASLRSHLHFVLLWKHS